MRCENGHYSFSCSEDMDIAGDIDELKSVLAFDKESPKSKSWIKEKVNHAPVSML